MTGGGGRDRDPLHPTVRCAGEEGRLPGWARVAPDRRRHLERVARAMGAWADRLDLPRDDTIRWRAAGLFHDALKDAHPDELRDLADVDWPLPLLHGPAVAARLRAEGVRDAELLRALSHHSVGHTSFATLGKLLYLADFLDPGREFERGRRGELRRRVPDELDAVLVEVVALRLGHLLDRRQVIVSETLDFWNHLLAAGADG